MTEHTNDNGDEPTLEEINRRHMAAYYKMLDRLYHLGIEAFDIAVRPDEYQAQLDNSYEGGNVYDPRPIIASLSIDQLEAMVARIEGGSS